MSISIHQKDHPFHGVITDYRVDCNAKSCKTNCMDYCWENWDWGKKDEFIEELKEAGWLCQGDWHICPKCRNTPIRQRMLKSDTAQVWEKVYYRMKQKWKTFRQAEALFAHENHYWPSLDVPLMPRNEIDWHKLIADVPYESLVPKEQWAEVDEGLF